MGRKPKDKAVTLCSHSSNAKCPNCKPRAQRLSKTTWQQRLKIVEWLEDEKNFKLITGAAATGPVKAGAKLTKKCAYEDLAHFVNEKCCSNWNIKNAKARYLAVYKSYKDAIRLFESADGEKFCLTSSEIAHGLTLERKKEEACYLFSRLDKLFGGRQNIHPTSVFDSGDAMSTDDDDDDDGNDDDDDDGNDDDDDDGTDDSENEKENQDDTLASSNVPVLPDFDVHYESQQNNSYDIDNEAVNYYDQNEDNSNLGDVFNPMATTLTQTVLPPMVPLRSTLSPNIITAATAAASTQAKTIPKANKKSRSPRAESPLSTSSNSSMNSTLNSGVRAAAEEAASESDGNATKGNKKSRMDFTSGYMKVKEAELEFNIQKFNQEVASDKTRQRVTMTLELARLGKSAAEIEELLKISGL